MQIRKLFQRAIDDNNVSNVSIIYYVAPIAVLSYL